MGNTTLACAVGGWARLDFMSSNHPSLPEYAIAISCLAEAVASCTPNHGHRDLITLLRQHGHKDLSTAKLATSRGNISLARRKVVLTDGTIVHDDHKAWLADQMQIDAGHPDKTYRRLSQDGTDYHFTLCEIEKLYIVCDRGNPDPADFVQLEIDVETERIDGRVFRSDLWDHLEDHRDLVTFTESYKKTEAVERTLVRPVAYRLRNVTDVQRFVEVAEGIEARRREEVRQRAYVMTDAHSGVTTTMTVAELDPGFDRYPGKARRIFDDWRNSSAGLSGARIVDHWAMSMSDYTDPRTGERFLNITPIWTVKKKLAEVDSSKGNDHGFFGKLQTLDERVGVPFGWYFFMLHGNRVHDGAGKRALQVAENGLVFMPEHDYKVLRSWRERPYGF